MSKCPELDTVCLKEVCFDNIIVFLFVPDYTFLSDLGTNGSFPQCPALNSALTPWGSAVEVLSHSQGTLKSDQSELHYNNKPALMSALWLDFHGRGGGNESLRSIHAGRWLLGRSLASWKAVVASWLTPLFTEFLCMGRLIHQWKATFFPLSGACLRRRVKEGGGKAMDNTRTQRWPGSQCEVSVPWWTNKQRGLSHGPTAPPIPRQHSSCSLIMLQTHAYSRADHVTSARDSA